MLKVNNVLSKASNSRQWKTTRISNSKAEIEILHKNSTPLAERKSVKRL